MANRAPFGAGHRERPPRAAGSSAPEGSFGTGSFLRLVGGTEDEPGRGSPRLASLNLNPRPGAVEGNLLLAEKALTRARADEPNLRWAVLPELFTSGYSGLQTVYHFAEDAEKGPSVRRFAELARDLDLFVAYGFPERCPHSTSVFDSVNLVGPEGLVLTYRKLNLVQETAEYRAFVPGSELPVVEAGGLRVAVVVCWDLGFPEVVRETASRGAELILAPAGWRDPFGYQYDLACAARALDNAVYVASANQLGAYPDARFSAPGGVYGPDGNRISSETVHPRATRSVAAVDPGFAPLWRQRYGSTLPAAGEPPILREALL